MNPSTIRCTTRSNLPLKYPLTMPIKDPMVTPMATLTSPTYREIREP